MKIVITMDLDDGVADPEHPMGVTEAAYEQIIDMLSQLGGHIDVARADS